MRSQIVQVFRRGLSAASKDWKNGLSDVFLQPIDRAPVLKQFPDFTIVKKCTKELRVSNPDRFAVIQLGSHQFKVMNEDVIYTERIPTVSVNDEVHLGKVLVWASVDQTIIGRPFIPGAFVHALIEEQCEDASVFVFKKKRRKRYRRLNQHTQELTGVRIIRVCDLEDLMSHMNKQSLQKE